MSHRPFKSQCNLALLITIAISICVSSGCQSVQQKLQYWKQNGYRVGPNYSTPVAPVAETFTQVGSDKISPAPSDHANWWQVFNDPELNLLIQTVQEQNLSLKAAFYRIQEARYQRNIFAANLLPQSQQTNGSFAHTQLSRNAGSAFPLTPLTINDWTISFDVGWELDFWGRIRRSVEAADASLEATIHDRNFVMVSLIGDTATLYIQIRAFDERIELAKKNVTLQEKSLEIAEFRFEEGRTSKLDVVQAETNLASTSSLIPQLELARRQSLNALAVLLGMPPSDIPFLSERPGKIPTVPAEVIVGIPADLICRRPDIRAAERNMAAQFEQIGIAEAELYPTFAVSGTLGWQAARLSNLFDSGSFNGTIAPGFSWNILNYGRLQNGINVEEARFKQIQLDFENTVLSAQREVEDGIVEFIKRKEQYEYDKKATAATEESVELALAMFTEGKTDFGRVFVVQTNLVTTQDRMVDTQASIALALINTYRALGGGWDASGGQSSMQTPVQIISAENPSAFSIEEAPEPINAKSVMDPAIGLQPATMGN